MKTITINQPWAHLICAGIKDIENRTWKTKFRGKVLVHASSKPEISISKFQCLTEQQRLQAFDMLTIEEYQNKLQTSAIIGSVEIIDCVVNHSSIWAEKRDGRLDSAKQWIEKPIYNWVLANPVLFAKPIPAKGKLSFWEYPMTEEEYFNIEKIGNPTK